MERIAYFLALFAPDPPPVQVPAEVASAVVVEVVEVVAVAPRSEPAALQQDFYIYNPIGKRDPFLPISGLYNCE